MSQTNPQFGLLPASPYEFLVPKEAEGTRLDVFLSLQNLPFSRSQMQRRIDEGEVTLDGGKAKPGHKLKPGQKIIFTPAPIRSTEDLPENLPLSILYEDAHLIVVNKSAGMVVHPAPGHETGTLVNALLFHCGPLPYPTYPVLSSEELAEDDMEETVEASQSTLAIGGEHRPGIVHRLDQGTSGILVCAKDELTLRGLQAQFQMHTIKREYIALVEGVLPEQGTFRTRYGRHPHDRKRFTARFGGKHAVTHYRVLERFPGATLALVRLETGRTHQIRVHFSEAGHPLLGDPLYNTHTKKGRPARLNEHHQTLGHQALHAQLLGFVHPKTQHPLEFSAPPPEDFLAVLTSLRQDQR